MEIQTVILTENGWWVNGCTFIPFDSVGAGKKAVLEWIAAGNEPEIAESIDAQ